MKNEPVEVKTATDAAKACYTAVWNFQISALAHELAINTEPEDEQVDDLANRVGQQYRFLEAIGLHARKLVGDGYEYAAHRDTAAVCCGLSAASYHQLAPMVVSVILSHLDYDGEFLDYTAPDGFEEPIDLPAMIAGVDLEAAKAVSKQTGDASSEAGARQVQWESLKRAAVKPPKDPQNETSNGKIGLSPEQAYPFVRDYINEQVAKGRDKTSITRDEIANTTGISGGTVSKTNAWQAIAALKREAKAKPAPGERHDVMDIDAIDEKIDWEDFQRQQEREERNPGRYD